MKIEKLVFVTKNVFYPLWNAIVNFGTLEIVSSIVIGSKITIIQTNNGTKEFSLWIKIQSNYDSEIFNIASADNKMVTETIRCIENFVTSETIVVILIDNEDFIDEFFNRDLLKKSDYYQENVNEHVTVFTAR